jgi:hypothetical protein
MTLRRMQPKFGAGSEEVPSRGVQALRYIPAAQELDNLTQGLRPVRPFGCRHNRRD